MCHLEFQYFAILRIETRCQTISSVCRDWSLRNVQKSKCRFECAKCRLYNHFDERSFTNNNFWSGIIFTTSLPHCSKKLDRFKTFKHLKYVKRSSFFKQWSRLVENETQSRSQCWDHPSVWFVASRGLVNTDNPWPVSEKWSFYGMWFEPNPG